MMRDWKTRAVIAVVLMVAVVASGRLYGAQNSATDENRIRIGWVAAASWVPWATLEQELPDGTTVELVPFKSSNDELTALSNGSIDMAPVGYNNVAALLTSGTPPVTFVSGISGNGSVFLARPDSGIQTWDDLRGKRIGSVRGSTQYVNLATGMKAHGLDIETDATYVNMQAFPDLNLALERGDVDAIVTFPPLSGEAEEAGSGVTVDEIQSQIYDGSFSVASGILANNTFLEQRREDAETVLDAYYRQMEKLRDDPQRWEEEFAAVTGSSGAGIADALEREYIRAETVMPMSEIVSVPAVLSQMGIIDQDTGDQLAELLDYSLLESITDESAEQLGKNE